MPGIDLTCVDIRCNFDIVETISEKGDGMITDREPSGKEGGVKRTPRLFGKLSTTTQDDAGVAQDDKGISIQRK